MQYERKSRSGWLATIGSVAALLAVTGCSFFGPVLKDDLNAFLANAKPYGTANDQACAQTLAGNWSKLEALTADDSGGLVAFAYRAIVSNRITQTLKQQALQDCGGLAAEILVQIGKLAMKFRP